MVVPDGAAEEDLAPGSQSHPSVTAPVTESPEPEIETIRHGSVYNFVCRFWMLRLMEQILVPELFPCL